MCIGKLTCWLFYENNAVNTQLFCVVNVTSAMPGNALHTRHVTC